jgi:thiazole synthase
MQNDPLIIAGKSFNSRLFMGSGHFSSQQVMMDALVESGAEIVTVAVRRINLQAAPTERNLSVQHLLREKNYTILPNTAGCYTADDAVFAAELAREALQTDWVKLEVVGERETLYPDVAELLRAAENLVRKGFVVLPYCSDDPVICQRLADMGCAAVMPLGSPIGSGQGILNLYNLDIIRSRISIPVVLDAGIGTASDAALAMEHGCDAVLLNTAVAKADDPILMARAMHLGTEAGRAAFKAGRVPTKTLGETSSPLSGTIKRAG